MNSTTFVNDYLRRSDAGTADAFLHEHTSQLNDSFVMDILAELKARADEYQRSSTADCQKVVAAMNQLAHFTRMPHHAALAHFAEGNMEIFALGRFAMGLDQLAQADAIFNAQGLAVEQAKLTISQVAGLVYLGQYDEAIKRAEWGRDIFKEANDDRRYAVLTLNLSNAYEQIGELDTAVALLDQCQDDFQSMAANGAWGGHLGWLQGNRAILLRTLGNYAESLQASEEALELFKQAQQMSEAHRVRQNMAVTYAVMGRTNEAVQLLDKTHTFCVNDGRLRDAIRVEIFLCEILLRIHRYDEVHQRCSQLYEKARQLENPREVALASLLEAQALRGMGELVAASELLERAALIFAEQKNEYALTRLQLEQAFYQLAANEPIRAFATALSAVETFGNMDATYDLALAHLVAAQALIAQQEAESRRADSSELDDGSVRFHIEHVLDLGSRLGIPHLTYLGFEAQGDLAILAENSVDALTAYDSAIAALEKVNGNLMVEHRIDFAAGNQRLYEKALQTAVALHELERALDYAERAKSRSLLEVMAYHIDLQVKAKDETDTLLIEELKELQSKRNRIYRELQSSEQLRFTNASQSAPSWEDLLALVGYENQITQLWQRLLVRNADYANDAARNWQWQGDSIQPYIEPGTLVLEYFIVEQQLIVFLIDQEAIRVHHLSIELAEVNELIEFFDLNCANVFPNQADPETSLHLLEQAQAILAELYQALVGPFADQLTAYQRLLIVPHQTLHRLPFHALYDGQAYLIEKVPVYYLPNASLMRLSQSNRAKVDATSRHHRQPCATFGYANNQQLPHSISEALQIAELLGGTAYVNDDATCAHLHAVAGEAEILHIATHGEFHISNPLFSGLTLADGVLTTLDVFDLELCASLVVLSACQTGRNVVSAGDELLGLLRGFLYARADSLLLTHWSVEDQSTAEFMGHFYKNLVGNGLPDSSNNAPITKVDALRHTQIRFIHQEPPKDMKADYRHPYWWASFFLVGHPGPL